MDDQKTVRRRGDELLEILFEATYKLINENRHTDITFQQIANAAQTSRTVLYRRWPTMFELIDDVYSYKAKKLFDGDFLVKIKYTDSLRGDLIQLLTVYQKVYTEIGIEVLNNYFYIKTQSKIRNKNKTVDIVENDKHILVIQTILSNAKARGEKIRKISASTLLLPFNLMRMENFAGTNKITKKRIEVITDEILLPVFLK